MSMQLHQTDYVSVVGELGESKIYGIDPKGNQTEESEEYILLFFTIQVNGKIKTFNHSFSLEISNITANLTLKNWKQWYILHRTLKDIGYSIGDDGGEHPIGAGIINEWIENMKGPNR